MRRTFTAEEKASVFELWKNGTGFSEIANILGSKPGTIFTMLRDTGGIKPHERKRAVAHLTLSEREEIRAGLSAKMSIRAIATALNRSPSTISREVQRNRGRRYYKAVDANNRANRMAKRPKPCLLDQNLPLRKLVLEKLEMKWSPEQISGWLRRTKPRQKTLRISPETIYKTLYFRSREALHHLNIQHLRRSHSLRHGRRHTRKGERGTINIVNGTPIHERSRNIDNRRSLGHWEGDLVSGTKNSHIATLVDRKSRYTIILRLRGKDSVSVNQALTDKFLSLPSELRKSLTLNRPGFPGECFICELRLPDHRFRWKHNKLFLLLPEEYGPAFPAIVDCYTSPPTLVWPVPFLHGFSSSYGVLPPLCKDH
ncbi:putative transposase [Escherichia coli 3030-1]|nr:putative transposase [Escherichia coli 3030-1]